MKKIISFSLWGHLPKYWSGAKENVALAKTLYPGWVCRFYIDSLSPSPLIASIAAEDCEVVMMEPQEEFAGLFWRFYAADDADLCICRDADSRLSMREVHAVNQWLASDACFHIMRDHPQHQSLIMGGMWGCRNMEGMRELVDMFPHKSVKGTDQYFLNQCIYPQIKDAAMVHDSYNLYGDGTPFPTPRVGGEFVGRIVDTE